MPKVVSHTAGLHRDGRGGDGVVVPGLWAAIYERHRRDAETDDLRAAGLPTGERERINANPVSTPSSARRAMAAMDRGEPQVTFVPSRGDFPGVANIDWTRPTPGRPPRCRVYSDDYCEPDHTRRAGLARRLTGWPRREGQAASDFGVPQLRPRWRASGRPHPL